MRDGYRVRVNPKQRSDSAARFVPDDADLDELRTAATRCRGCELYRDATQVVFGEGSVDARVVLVGEQPGDQEDRKGAPFVGPAGRILDQALVDAGIERSHTYVTNAVKHFKFYVRPERGKRRLHKPPTRAEVLACRPWLEAELGLLHPEVLVCLGATAAKAVIGPKAKLAESRGKPLHVTELDYHAPVVATIHPSAVLRAGEDRDAMYDGLVADLTVVAGELDS